MVRRSLLVAMLVWGVAFLVLAQEVPVLVQPSQAGYTQAQRATLDEAVTQLGYILRRSDLASKRALGDDGWTQQKAAAYTAGTLQRLGYEAIIVSRTVDDGGTKIWVVARVNLSGAVAWVPVEPSSDTGTMRVLGRIPHQLPLGYDPNYMAYDAVVELPPNLPPTAFIRPPVGDVAELERTAWFANRSSDPDGEIISYQWTFGEDVQPADDSFSIWYEFAVGGQEYTISVTVTDSRGAQATASLTEYVLTTAEKEAKSCGCGGG